MKYLTKGFIVLLALICLFGCKTKHNALIGTWHCVKKELSTGDSLDVMEKPYYPDFDLKFIDDKQIKVEQSFDTVVLSYSVNNEDLSFGVLKFNYQLLGTDTLVLKEVKTHNNKFPTILADEFFIRTFIKIEQ